MASRSLERAQRWLANRRQVQVYFDNDGDGDAPRDALRLLELLS